MNLLKSLKFSVTKRTLLFEAAVIWTIAGVILLSRGSSMLEVSSGFSWLKIIGCICGGLIFFVLVFLKISRKHVNRIINLHGDHHQFYEFFNFRSYMMMIGMISLGVFLRKTSIVPLASLSLAYLRWEFPCCSHHFGFTIAGFIIYLHLSIQ